MSDFEVLSATDRLTHRDPLVPADPTAFGLLMQGVGLGDTSEYGEPFELIVEHIEKAYEKKRIQIDLAKMARQQLDAFAAGKLDPSFPRPQQLIYNVFHLCADLPRPEQLWGSLHVIYTQLKQGRDLGVWDGNKHLDRALCAALIENQGGPELRDEWMNMLSDAPTALKGRVYDGWQGILRMPASAEDIQKRPWMDPIGEALFHLSKRLGDLEDQRAEFDRYLAEAEQFWSDFEGWNSELLRVALEKKWPRWAVWRLPRINTPALDDPTRWYIWQFVRESIPVEFGVQEIRAWPTARVSEVLLGADASIFVRCVTPLFEEYRLAAGFHCDNSMRAVVNYVLLYLERRAADLNSRDVELFWKARMQLLKNLRNAAADTSLIESPQSSLPETEDDRSVERRLESEPSMPVDKTELQEKLMKAAA